MSAPSRAACAVALAAVALTVGACKREGDRLAAASTGFCTPFRTAQSNQPAAVASDPSTGFEDCIHGWAYALAPSRDPADLVAQATVEACATRLSQWNQQTLAQNPEAAQQAPSLTTGQPTDAISSHAQYAQSRALFYVVQARAAHCAPPPTSAVPPVGPRGG